MFPRIRCAPLLLLLVPFSAGAEVTCADVLKSLGGRLADPSCFQSTDLTTANTLTTPANNSLGLAPGAFTPTTDRDVIAPSAAKRKPITKTVPGLQLNARIASDPTGQARFLLRLPNDWNGRLVVAGTSNGGYQVRRAVELAPGLFDGGVDWEGTFVDEHAPNLLTDLPAAIFNFPDYVASNFDPASTAAKNIRDAGYPPDIIKEPLTMWNRYSNQFWEVTQCQWQKRLDPSYDTYGSDTGTYNYVSRLSVSDVGAQFAAFATTGKIRRPLVTVAGTMDALLPIDHHARAYARKVAAASKHKRDDDDDGD